MITVTEEAKELLSRADTPEGEVLRLDPVTDPNTGETVVGMTSGQPQGDDQIVEHDGEVVLSIAGPVSTALDGSTVQKMDTPEGPGIGISGPEGGAAPADGS